MHRNTRHRRNDIVRLQSLANIPEPLFDPSRQPVPAANVDDLGHLLASPAKICLEAARQPLGHAQLQS